MPSRTRSATVAPAAKAESIAKAVSAEETRHKAALKKQLYHYDRLLDLETSTGIATNDMIKRHMGHRNIVAEKINEIEGRRVIKLKRLIEDGPSPRRSARNSPSPKGCTGRNCTIMGGRRRYRRGTRRTRRH